MHCAFNVHAVHDQDSGYSGTDTNTPQRDARDITRFDTIDLGVPPRINCHLVVHHSITCVRFNGVPK